MDPAYSNLSQSKYIISLDAIDLNFIPTASSCYRGREITQIWTKGNLDLRENEYFEFEIKENHSESNDGDDADIQYDYTTCHICDIEVPKPYLKDHVTSKKHKTYKKILDISLERLKKVINNVEVFEDANISDSVYFCTSCVAVVNKDEKISHEKTLTHKNSLMVDKILNDFLDLYDNNDSKYNYDNIAVDINSNKIDNTHEVKEPFTVNNTKGHEKIDKVVDSINLQRDIYEKIVRTTPEFKKNLYVYIDFLKSTTHLKDVKVLEDNYLEIIPLSGIRVKISADNFNGIKNETVTNRCTLCRKSFAKNFNWEHLYEQQHVDQVSKPFDNENCIRNIDASWSHCALCNIGVENIELHITSAEDHKLLLKEAAPNSNGTGIEYKTVVDKVERPDVTDENMNNNNLQIDTKTISKVPMVKNNLQAYIEFLLHTTKLKNIKIKHSNMLVITTVSGIKVQILELNFNGLVYAKKKRMKCNLCQKIFYTNMKWDHLYEKNHVDLVSIPFKNRNCIRKITTDLNHCAVCNTCTSNQALHITLDEKHKLHLNKALQIDIIDVTTKPIQVHEALSTHNDGDDQVASTSKTKNNKIKSNIQTIPINASEFGDENDNNFCDDQVVSTSKNNKIESNIQTIPVKESEFCDENDNHFCDDQVASTSKTKNNKIESNIQTIPINASEFGDENDNNFCDDQVVSTSKNNKIESNIQTIPVKESKFFHENDTHFCDDQVASTSKTKNNKIESNIQTIPINASEFGDENDKNFCDDQVVSTSKNNKIESNIQTIPVKESELCHENDNHFCDDQVVSTLKTKNNKIECNIQTIPIKESELCYENDTHCCEKCSMNVTDDYNIHVRTHKIDEVLEKSEIHYLTSTTDSDHNLLCKVCKTMILNNDIKVEEHFRSLYHNANYKKMLELNNINEFMKYHFHCKSCEVCFVKTKEMIHINSKQHEKNENVFRTEIQAKKQPKASPLPEMVLLKCKNDIINDKSFRCIICNMNVPNHNYNIYTHLISALHIKAATKLTCDEVTYIHYHMNLTNYPKLSCMVCNVQLTINQNNILTHVNGNTHKSLYKLTLKDNKVVKQSDGYICKLCNVSLNPMNEFIHCYTKKHIKLLAEYQNKINKQNVESTSQLLNETQTKEIKTYLLEDFKDNPKVFFCIVCNAIVPKTVNNITQHLGGVNHRSLYDSVLEENNIIKCCDDFECKLCKMFIVTGSEFKHISTKAHQDKKKDATKYECFICKVKLSINDENIRLHNFGEQHIRMVELAAQNDIRIYSDKCFCERCEKVLENESVSEHSKNILHIMSSYFQDK